MEYQKYRKAIFDMWEAVKAEDIVVETVGDEEYLTCGLCNPEFNAFNGRTAKQPCPLDTRSEKDIDPAKPCIDHCFYFVRSSHNHKVKILMSKFMSKFVTKEGIESLKDLAKACRGQKGTSKAAAEDFVQVAEKVISSTRYFGGFVFEINDGKLKGARRND